MKIKILSDLHNEFEESVITKGDADIIVLAGDIHVKTKGIDWLKKFALDIPVLYVLGNHEYYGSAYPKLIKKMKEAVVGTNIHILENDVFKYKGVNFLGCTLWTDFELFGPPKHAGVLAKTIMNDYKKIRFGPSYEKFSPLISSIVHTKSIKWLTEELVKLKEEKNVVITHHAPSLLSVPDYRKEKLITSAYASDLEKTINNFNIELWIHGHIHQRASYFMGKTKVVSNPKGYPDKPVKDFDLNYCEVV